MPSQDFGSLQQSPPSLAQPTMAAATAPAQQSDANECGLKFDDPRLAFAAHSNTQLLRGVAVFGLCSLRPLVRHAESGLRAAKRVLGRPVVNATIRHTFFKHFCAGGCRDNRSHGAEMHPFALHVLDEVCMPWLRCVPWQGKVAEPHAACRSIRCSLPGLICFTCLIMMYVRRRVAQRLGPQGSSTVCQLAAF